MNTQPSVKKKWLAYLAVFLIMLSFHHLMGENRSGRQYTADANHSGQFTLCMDYLTDAEYYRLNCPVCRALIESLSAHKTLNL
ncbi:hypothetical protein CLV62_13518 [Dysgonomonas alginatilytica]|uniref:Uncharacterized protein n=1 Tax=Dysgonomonas alginatilytica TaxID=1605892 RepID=A0A2V3PIR2_9BACT|nr:hypothetical protein [Dysgonomonas alginatilytica]PXV59446.1 hypothetical protein CLV62_13518 [Dysgonomonas alginatilytica]